MCPAELCEDILTCDTIACSKKAEDSTDDADCFFVDAIIETTSSVSCVTAALAKELGVVRDPKDGPEVRLADGRKVRVHKKIALIRINLTINQNERMEEYSHVLQCAVMPAESREVSLDRHTMNILKRDVLRRKHLPPDVQQYTDWQRR